MVTTTSFIESIAQVMSRALTDEETEKLLTSFRALQSRLKDLSTENLKRLEAESKAQRPFCKHKGTCSGNAFRGLVKAFLTLYAVKYGLSFVPALITGQVWRNPRILLKIGGKDTTTFALFLSTFISSYKAFLCLFRRLRSTDDYMNPFLAGCIAGTSLYLDANRSRRIMVALYLSTRTLHFLCRWVWQRRLEPLITGKEGGSVKELEELEEGEKGHRHHHRHHHGHHHSRQRSLGGLERIELEALKSNSGLSGGEVSPPLMVKKGILGMDSANSNGKVVGIEGSVVVAKKSQEETQKDDEWIVKLRKNVRYTAGTLVMMLASSQILMAYVLEPQSVASSYQSFLLTHGGIRTHQPKRARDYLQVMATVLRSGFKGHSTKYLQPDPSTTDGMPPSFESNLPPNLDVARFEPYFDYINQAPHDWVMCSFQHPKHTNCELGALDFFGQEFKRALQMYVPLNGIMTLVFRGTSLWKKPGQNLWHYLVQTARSTLFLSAYCTMAWYSVCSFRRIFKKDALWMYYVNGMLCGATVLIEAPGRRLELGLYCLPRAFESLWNCGVTWGWWRDIPNGEGIYFSLMTGVLMMLYQKDPSSIHDG
ncbi:hypothetical protein HDU98_008808 [Podochytrium sp. JEL0797]|nr:hypothetical protein HDU98_008808 [Podochytrium sp. JEL0797]